MQEADQELILDNIEHLFYHICAARDARWQRPAAQRHTCTAPHLPWRAVPGNAHRPGVLPGVRCKCAADMSLQRWFVFP
jgi:hypothetical protein